MMWSKSASVFLSAMVALVLMATNVRAEELPFPGALVAILHSFSPKGRCHCAVRSSSLAIDASAADHCHQLPIGFQPQAVDTEDDWHGRFASQIIDPLCTNRESTVFLFDKSDCSDEGGWLFPRTVEDPKVCNYKIGDPRAFAVSRPVQGNHTKFKFGNRRGKIDQYCGT